eukprot:m.58253 g.58253  ORF g.58253 m.58253 type:complete len:80 (-) comp11253_c0_seq2:299-538(-)
MNFGEHDSGDFRRLTLPTQSSHTRTRVKVIAAVHPSFHCGVFFAASARKFLSVTANVSLKHFLMSFPDTFFLGTRSNKR